MKLLDRFGKGNGLKMVVVFLVFLGLLGAYATGLYAGKNACTPLPPGDADMTLFWETWHTLESKFADKEKIDHQKMVYGAIAGMVSAVGDPYTSFFDPTDTKKFEEDTNGAFEGVGLQIGIKKGQLTVIAPIENSPAQKAGIKAGDAIVKIGGTESSTMTTDEAVNLIRGPKGTDVVLTIFREGWKDTKDFKLTRDVIKVAAVKWEIKDNDVAYIEINQFTANADTEFKKAAVDIINSRAKRIVLDLRNDPGGFLDVAETIAGWLLKDGDVVTQEKTGSETTMTKDLATGPSLLLKYPIVVLINEGSASASEILAGALRDNRGIKLIGKKSFGKGSVQQLVEFGDKSSLKVTIAKWYTPKGDQISEVGLSPDIEVARTAEDEDAGKDPQLDKAIEIVKGLQ